VSASVAIGAGAYADDGDLLTAATAGTGISASYDPATETLSLSGSGSAGLYQQVLDSVTFQSSAADPTGGSRNPFRSVSWQVSDANGAIAGAGTTLLINPPTTVSSTPSGTGDLLFQNTDGTIAGWVLDANGSVAQSMAVPDPGPELARDRRRRLQRRRQGRHPVPGRQRPGGDVADETAPA